MATTRECRQALYDLVVDWFVTTGPPAEYDAPIIAGNIRRYRTAPAPSSASPNWILITTAGTRPEEPEDRGSIAGGNETEARFVIVLLSRLSEGSDAEASKEAAENWLDDAEEWLVRQLADSYETDEWHSLEIVGWPMRDLPGLTDGLSNDYRSSQIVIQMEKK